MTFVQYLTVMFIGTTGAWLAWLITLFMTDPTETSIVGFVFFYLTLFIALVGSITIVGSAIRRLVKKSCVLSRQVYIAFRHAILFSFLIVGSLILVSFNVWRWWTVVLFIGLLTFIELFFLSAKRKRPSL